MIGQNRAKPTAQQLTVVQFARCDGTSQQVLGSLQRTTSMVHGQLLQQHSNRTSGSGSSGDRMATWRRQGINSCLHSRG